MQTRVLIDSGVATTLLTVSLWCNLYDYIIVMAGGN